MSGKREAGSGVWPCLVAALMSLVCSGTATAHETDQFTVPVGEEYVDLGEYFNDYFLSVVEEGVRRTNRRIELAMGSGTHQFSKPVESYGKGVLYTSDNGTTGRTLAYLYSSQAIAHSVRRSFPDAVTLIEGLESVLHKKKMKAQYPGKIVAYHPSDFDSVFAKAHFPLDPRSLFRLWRASTVKVNGTYLGTDKMGHFVDMGYHYFKAYNNQLRKGKDERLAMYNAVHAFDTGLLSENSVLGYATAGAYSNADMASNYLGCLFYRNLTEPVRLKGQLRPAMAVRIGDYWMVNPAIKDDPAFFSWYISDHLDEALNPSHFEKGMQNAIRKAIRDRLPSLLDWYADESGKRRPAGYFEYTMYDLSTYYNSDYGHSRKFDELIHLDSLSE
jgi:hypothetical protein